MLTCLLVNRGVEPEILQAVTDMELLIEARWVILKVAIGVIVLFYLSATGIHISNRLPIDRALFGVNKDVCVIINCRTDARRI